MTSPSADFLQARMDVVTQTFMKKIFLKDSVTHWPKVKVQCANNPCLSPGSAIELNAFVETDDSRSAATATIRAYVDAWR